MDTETKNEVAIKVLKQATVAAMGKHRHVFREKDILLDMDNQFII